MPENHATKQIKTIDIFTGICAAVLVADVIIIYGSAVVSPIPGHEARWFEDILRWFAGVGLTALVALPCLIWLRLQRRKLKERGENEDAERLFHD